MTTTFPNFLSLFALDGGRYIGIWHSTINRDPDSRRVNWDICRPTVIVGGKDVDVTNTESELVDPCRPVSHLMRVKPF